MNDISAGDPEKLSLSFDFDVEVRLE